ncbi:hypothetical protein EZS27_017604 [termite gut metagenome]|uniref:Phosphoribosyltransferase domain-containing protein n=1 Tax=termite gut metagenome TaxID=433724 RepID=A0A5J4RMF6_9ZZZZ
MCNLISIISTIAALFTIVECANKFVIFSMEHLAMAIEAKAVNKDIKPVFSILNQGFFARLTWKQSVKGAKYVANKVKEEKFEPTLIIGIGRGGAIFGSLISVNLGNMPIIVMDRRYKWPEVGRTVDIIFDFKVPKELLKRVLLVAGEVNIGGTITEFHKYLTEQEGVEAIKLCAFYKQKGNMAGKIDYNYIEGSKIMLMPWQDNNYIRDSIRHETKMP